MLNWPAYSILAQSGWGKPASNKRTLEELKQDSMIAQRQAKQAANNKNNNLAMYNKSDQRTCIEKYPTEYKK